MHVIVLAIVLVPVTVLPQRVHVIALVPVLAIVLVPVTVLVPVIVVVNF